MSSFLSLFGLFCLFCQTEKSALSVHFTSSARLDYSSSLSAGHHKCRIDLWTILFSTLWELLLLNSSSISTEFFPSIRSLPPAFLTFCVVAGAVVGFAHLQKMCSVKRFVLVSDAPPARQTFPSLSLSQRTSARLIPREADCECCTVSAAFFVL